MNDFRLLLSHWTQKIRVNIPVSPRSLMMARSLHCYWLGGIVALFNDLCWTLMISVTCRFSGIQLVLLIDWPFVPLFSGFLSISLYSSFSFCFVAFLSVSLSSGYFRCFIRSNPFSFIYDLNHVFATDSSSSSWSKCTSFWIDRKAFGRIGSAMLNMH